jgi:branched-subunit amino acid ABC-type transport system permease component
MRDYLPFILIGLTTGGVYALASLGLVLTYRTSGVFNFGHGAIAMAATYGFYSLRQQMPTALAAAIAILVIAPLFGIVLDRFLFRRLAGAGPTAAIVASLGLLVGLQGLAVALYGGQTRGVDPIFPSGTYRLFDYNVGVDQTFVVAIAIAGGLALMAFFRFTHLGLQTRAVVDNRALSGLVGTNAGAVTRIAWMLGCAFAATSGILFAPFVGLDSLLLTLLVVQAFGAAVAGRLRSFPITALAAFGLGVAQAITTKIVGSMEKESLTGLPNALPFLLLFGVLILSGRGTLREAPATRPPSRLGRSRAGGPRFPIIPIAVVAVATAAVAPSLSGSRLLTLSTTVGFMLLFASLSLLIGLSRQLSLTHAVFVALGATTLSHLQSSGVPYLLALPLAALIVTPIGAALAIPAIRLSGLYLGLATFGFGILAQSVLFPTGLTFGSQRSVFIQRPGFLSSDLAFFYFVLVVVLLGLAAVEILRVTRLGRILVALGDSPTAVGSLGVSPLAARVITFCLSTFLAALSGGLLGSLVRAVNPTTFTFFHSLIWVTVLVAVGARTFGGSALAAAALVAVPAVFTAPAVAEWQPVVFGVSAILLAQADNGLIGVLPGLARRLRPQPGGWRVTSERAYERYLGLAGAAAGGAALDLTIGGANYQGVKR